MTDPVVLTDGVAEVAVCPDLGGGLAAYDLWRGGRRAPLFRRAPASTADPFALASIVLVPWSNRISGGGFAFGHRFHALAPNLPGEACPIHGNGFQLPWHVTQRASEAVTLTVASNGPGPFRYEATLRYALAGGALTMRLDVTHCATEKLPYGLGFHPWLPRTAATTLCAPAAHVWLEDARHLPAGRVAISARPAWDFARARALPSGWVNNGFDGWGCTARIAWPDRRLALTIDAAPPLGAYLLYSPGAHGRFFCFEPVTHPVDAHNLPGAPGLIALAAGETASVACRFAPD